MTGPEQIPLRVEPQFSHFYYPGRPLKTGALLTEAKKDIIIHGVNGLILVYLSVESLLPRAG